MKPDGQLKEPVKDKNKKTQPDDRRIIKGAFPREEELLESAGLISYEGRFPILTDSGIGVYRALEK
jgi:hypothetical protein